MHCWKIIIVVLMSLGSLFAGKSILFAQSTAPEDGYLFAYFEGNGKGAEQEALRFAVSEDAAHWSALGGNKPVMDSDSIAATGGIRDPHLLIGVDGNHFYLVATDMNTVKNGWDHNPDIVMLHSDDFIDWKGSVIDLAKLYPDKFGHVKWVWAPQTIYDHEKKNI